MAFSLFVFAEIICIVSELSDSEVDVRFTPDERTGFFTHSVLNVSWCPSNCMCLFDEQYFLSALVVDLWLPFYSQVQIRCHTTLSHRLQ